MPRFITGRARPSTLGTGEEKKYNKLIWQKTIKNVYEPARTYQACGEAWWGLDVPTHQHSPNMLCWKEEKGSTCFLLKALAFRVCNLT